MSLLITSKNRNATIVVTRRKEMKVYFQPISQIFLDNWKGLVMFFFLLPFDSFKRIQRKINPSPGLLSKDEETHTHHLVHWSGNLRRADTEGTVISQVKAWQSTWAQQLQYFLLFPFSIHGTQSQKSRASLYSCSLFSIALLRSAHYWAPICTHKPPPCPQPAPAVWKEKSLQVSGQPIRLLRFILANPDIPHSGGETAVSSETRAWIIKTPLLMNFQSLCKWNWFQV